MCATECREDLQLVESEEEKAEKEVEKRRFEATLRRVKDILGDKVEKVTLSHRTVSSPCVLVTGEFGWSATGSALRPRSCAHSATSIPRLCSALTRWLVCCAQVGQHGAHHEVTALPAPNLGSLASTEVEMHRAPAECALRCSPLPCVLCASPLVFFTPLLCTSGLVVACRAQALRDTSMSQFMVSKKTLELNPHHRLIRALQQRVEGGEKEGEGRLVEELVHLLYDTALLVSGFSLPDPAAYARRIHRLVGLGLGVEGDEEVQESAQAADKGEAGEGGRKEEPPPLVDEGTVMEEVD